jgi:diguanylate cyclase (GGDEF)-like protein/PAS domain S-box-containing protein
MGLPVGSSSDFDGSTPDLQFDRDSAGDAPLGLPAWLWSLLALALGIAGTLWAAQLQQDRIRIEQRAQLGHMVDSSFAALQDQLHASESLARAVQTVFLASGEVTAQEFAHAYANLRPRERFPSLQALAFARREPSADGDHYITELVAPETGNRAIIGLDVNTQPTNLAAVLRSRDEDRAILSAPFRLAQQDDPGAPVDGITLRLPIFDRGPPPGSVAERRERMLGSLAISFRVRNLIEDSLPDDVRERLHVEVADVTDGPGAAMFDSHPGPHQDFDPDDRFDRELRFGGRRWHVGMHPVATGVEGGIPWTLGLPGLLASALFALLVWSAATTRRRALELGWRMSRRFRESEERFRALNELLPALVLLTDEHGRITYANQAARNRLGERVAAVDLAALFEDPDVRARMREHDQAACSNAEALLRSTNGDRFWANLSIAPVVVSGRRKLLLVASDVSEQRQLTELLSYQASHDALTELYNRREFERRVERMLAHMAPGGSPSALLYIDLDQFKLINDTSGHIAGDQLLTQLASHMREQLRGGDVLARLGGDEFGVLAANVGDLAGAQRIAERLREQIDGYLFSWEQRSYPVSASIGGVMIDHPDISMKELFAQADTACYMAKEDGRNRVHFYSEQDDETSQRRGEMEWVNRLRWALEEDRLLLDYQELRALPSHEGQPPQIEVLLRLRDEDGRIVLPGAFLPAAERYGLMPQIDRWVVETTLANFDQLHDDGPALALCEINLSGASIEDDSLADLILELLERHQVDPARVCFEITETVAVRNLARVGAFIGRLREVGCQFALDDFGAGMSSFGYLKNLPVDFIKIDGSFIRDIARDPMSQAIVQAVTDIGHQRGMQVIAEWVSSEEIIDRLVEIGVDFAQGFALHKPEPVLFQRGQAH